MKMWKIWSLWGVLLISSSCEGRNLFEIEDAKVVSIYTTLPPTMKTPPPLDIYQQIAHNIAEKVTSPIYRLFGFNRTSTQKPTWENLELVDEIPEEVTKASVNPVSNELDAARDVEELSAEALTKIEEKKPEKITLYSSYLPLDRVDKDISADLNDANSTVNSLPDDDDFNFDEFEDDEETKNYSGGFIYFFELIGSFVTLLFGALQSYFRPSARSGSS